MEKRRVEQGRDMSTDQNIAWRRYLNENQGSCRSMVVKERKRNYMNKIKSWLDLQPGFIFMAMLVWVVVIMIS